jgi:hypothetical protein
VCAHQVIACGTRARSSYSRRRRQEASLSAVGGMGGALSGKKFQRLKAKEAEKMELKQVLVVLGYAPNSVNSGFCARPKVGIAMAEPRRASGLSHSWTPLATHMHRAPRSGCEKRNICMRDIPGGNTLAYGRDGGRRCVHEPGVDIPAVPDSEPGCNGAGSQYEPYLAQSKYLSDKLFCRITGRYVAKTEAAVVRHSDGRRFNTGVGAPIRARLS